MSGLSDSGARLKRGIPTVGVVVPAAGLGRRMGTPKQFLELAGEPILRRALRPFLEYPGVEAAVVALPPDHAAEPPSWLMESDERIHVVSGGSSRRDSVWAALQLLPCGLDVIVVHDGARPLVSSVVVARCVEVAAGGIGAVAGFPVVDTLKCVDGEGIVTETVDRSQFWHAQTPQAFPGHALIEAYRRAVSEDWLVTDDAELMERAGGQVMMVESLSSNLKVTRPSDLDTAESLLDRRGP